MSLNKHLKGSGYPLPWLLQLWEHLCNERPDLLSLVMNCLSVSSLVCPVMPAEWSQGSPLCFGCQVWVVLGGERRFHGEWLCFLTTQSLLSCAMRDVSGIDESLQVEPETQRHQIAVIFLSSGDRGYLWKWRQAPLAPHDMGPTFVTEIRQ